MGAQTILLVEDNEDDIFFMKRAVKSAGLSNPLKVVTDGQQAIEYLAGTGNFADRAQFPLPILILLDLKLPHKSGHEVLAWIRQQKNLQHQIVIILSTSRERRDLEASYALGANAFLVKPPEAVQLSAMMKAINDFWIVHNQFPAAPVLK